MSPVDLLVDGLYAAFAHVVEALAIGIPAFLIAGRLLAEWLRSWRLMWTWATPAVPLGLLVAKSDLGAGLLVAGVGARAWRLGHRWHRDDLRHGADLAEEARSRLGILNFVSRHLPASAVMEGGDGWLRGTQLVVGRDERDREVCVPFGRESGLHTLIVGATGSGKTVTETWIVCRLIEAGHGAVVLDPKGDRLLHDELERQAAVSGKRFLEWTPEGPLAYNPYASGTHTEIADKALAGEQFTEPHYLRQAQRYLGHAVRAMHAAGVPVTPGSLMAQLDPKRLDVTARSLPEEHANELQGYLDSLGDRQRRELSGVRDRLSILAESDIRSRLEPVAGVPGIDLHQAVAEQAVVYFRLDADRRVLLSSMLASAIVLDLVALVATRQRDPIPTAVVIDEFSAIARDTVARLFSRGRSAGVSLVLATQELADIRRAGDGLLEQVQGNLSTLIAHRQVVPGSADLIAAIAGTRPVWTASQQTGRTRFGAPSTTAKGTRRREREHIVQPSRISELQTGWAAVVTPGGSPPAIARIGRGDVSRVG
jgi:conjugal transfer pilus assembly protein TraD